MILGKGLSCPPPAIPNPAQRAPTGPTADKLAEQDTKLHSLEAALKTIQETQESQAKQIDKVHTDVQHRDAQLRKHMDHGLSSLKSELDASFAAALKQQSQSFDRNLGEIQQLLLAAPKRKIDDTPMYQD